MEENPSFLRGRLIQTLYWTSQGAGVSRELNSPPRGVQGDATSSWPVKAGGLGMEEKSQLFKGAVNTNLILNHSGGRRLEGASRQRPHGNS